MSWILILWLAAPNQSPAYGLASSVVIPETFATPEQCFLAAHNPATIERYVTPFFVGERVAAFTCSIGGRE